jgi:hypothetical protein
MANATPVKSGKPVKVAKRNTARPVRLRNFVDTVAALTPEDDAEEPKEKKKTPKVKAS